MTSKKKTYKKKFTVNLGNDGKTVEVSPNVKFEMRAYSLPVDREYTKEERAVIIEGYKRGMLYAYNRYLNTDLVNYSYLDKDKLSKAISKVKVQFKSDINALAIADVKYRVETIKHGIGDTAVYGEPFITGLDKSNKMQINTKAYDYGANLKDVYFSLGAHEMVHIINKYIAGAYIDYMQNIPVNERKFVVDKSMAEQGELFDKMNEIMEIKDAQIPDVLQISGGLKNIGERTEILATLMQLRIHYELLGYDVNDSTNKPDYRIQWLVAKQYSYIKTAFGVNLSAHIGTGIDPWDYEPIKKDLDKIWLMMQMFSALDIDIDIG